MKKTLLLLMSLLLSLTFLTSCADIKVQKSVNKLDALQEKYEQKSYECSRWDEESVDSFAELIVSGSGVLLKGEITGIVEYTYRDESADKFVYGFLIGTTNKADAKAVGAAYAASLEDVVTDMETTIQAYYVQIEYTLR